MAIMVTLATPARAISRTGNPASLTDGPMPATTNELTPKPMASRMPVTRLRRRSSMYFTIIASVKGMAPNTKIMNSVVTASSAQPSTCEASRNSGTWQSRIGR